MKRFIAVVITCFLVVSGKAQQNDQVFKPKKWGVEINVLWPIFPGNIYKGQVTYEAWRNKHIAGDVYAGVHIRPFEFREAEGQFSNLALTFGYRQFLWEGLHLEVYQAFGPGYNKENAIDGKSYTSWDYEVGLLAGYRWEFLSREKRIKNKVSPYISTQHGVFYLAAQSNPHPIIGSSGEAPIYVGTLNFGIRF